MTILVAEDETMMLKTIELRLKKDGYTVQTAKDGQEALDKLAETAPDLVITDMMMPYATGMDVIRKSKVLFPYTPVIILSAMGNDNEIAEAIEAGAIDYLVKPFSLTELSIRVKKMIEN